MLPFPTAAMVLAAAVSLGLALGGRHSRSVHAVLPAAVMLLAMLQHATGALGMAGALIVTAALLVTAPVTVTKRSRHADVQVHVVGDMPARAKEVAPSLHRALLSIATAFLLLVAAGGESGSLVSGRLQQPSTDAHLHAASGLEPLIAVLGVGALVWTTVLVSRLLRRRRFSLGLECAGMGASVTVMAAMLLA